MDLKFKYIYANQPVKLQLGPKRQARVSLNMEAEDVCQAAKKGEKERNTAS